MAKYDAVDRLMEQASEPARTRESDATAEAVLESQVSASEPLPPPVPASVSESSQGALPMSALSKRERGRNILGSLRPLLPAVSGALRLVDHGAVQAIARLLPMLGGFGGPTIDASSLPIEPGTQFAELLSTLEKRQSELATQLEAQREGVAAYDEQLRRIRDSMARVSAEQNAQQNQLASLTDRFRLIAAVVIVLILLVIAEMVLLFVFLHK